MAGELARAGHRVTVFEALHDAGGVLVYGIPEFRLPKSILVAEVAYLERLGVEFRMNFIVGKTATIDDLRAEGYEAFFIGTGAGLPNFMKIPGENLVGVYSANEYLTRVNLMRAYDFPNYDTPVFPGRRAAVIGGGNVAMDSVRTAKRLGAEQALIIYRRSRAEMPARDRGGPSRRGGRHRVPLPDDADRYIGDEHGRVKAMECLRMELGEPDASGRRRPVPVPGLGVHDRGRPRRRGHRPEPEPAHPPDDPGPQRREMGHDRRRLGDHGDLPPGRLLRRRHRPGRGDRHPGHGRRPDGRRRHGPSPQGRSRRSGLRPINIRGDPVHEENPFCRARAHRRRALGRVLLRRTAGRARRPHPDQRRLSTTMSAKQPRAEALAVAGGKIVFVGDSRKALTRRGGATRVVDLGGRMVLPAFQDSHIHLVMGGVELLACNIAELATKEAVFARIRDYAAAHPDLPWITGGGWDLPLFPQANPRKEDLDALVPDRPAVLDSADGHCCLGQLAGPGPGRRHPGHAGPGRRPHRARPEDGRADGDPAGERGRPRRVASSPPSGPWTISTD